MPMVHRSQTIGIDAFVENLIAGSEFEFAPGPQRVAIGIVGDVATGPGEITIQFGNEVITSNTAIPLVGAGSPVLLDAHMYFQDVAAGGDRIKISVRGGAIALPIRMLMQTLPIG